MNSSINAVRMFSIEMIEKANSGHPGICMGAAPMITSLYSQELKVYSKESKWFNRDRFILAAGHGSAMLYSTLHLSGYNITIDDLKQFRQLNSKTPGHPEVDHTDGVDATSGPLGQGIAQAVGMALAEKHLASKFNKYSNVIDHYTFALCGDGDLQEGVSAEASSFAGHIGLNKLIVLWDSNDIQLDYEVSVANSEDVLKRYESYGWDTILVKDGNNIKLIQKAIQKAKKNNKPTLIEVKTVIGFGAPNKGNKPDAHGAPLGGEEVELVKNNYNWVNNPFEVNEDVYEKFQKNTVENGKNSYDKWLAEVEVLKEKDNKLYAEYNELFKENYEISNLSFDKGHIEATRVSSGKAINNINKQIGNLIGGSADLSKSNNTFIEGEEIISKGNYKGKNIAYGVREFAMAAISNGIMLHGGLKAFCSTFFVFSDYLKPALRLSAIQNLPAIYVLTHDSVAVGEDGPTHQPIEQLTGLRSIPNTNIFRPCDANETQACWSIALNETKRPSVLVLSRQNLEVLTDNGETQSNVNKGAYIISDSDNFEKVLIASGSEVGLALEVKKLLENDGVNVRVVSMPSLNIFENQSEEYKMKVLGETCLKNRFFIEMASGFEGYKYARNVIGINTFGSSGKGEEVIENYGFTPKAIYNQIKQQI